MRPIRHSFYTGAEKLAHLAARGDADGHCRRRILFRNSTSSANVDETYDCLWNWTIVRQRTALGRWTMMLFAAEARIGP